MTKELELIKELEVLRVQSKLNNGLFRFGVKVDYGELRDREFTYLITCKNPLLSKENWSYNIDRAYLARRDDEEKIVCFHQRGVRILSYPRLKKEINLDLRDNNLDVYLFFEKELAKGNFGVLETFLNS